MPSTPDLFHLAAEYHRALPQRIREYLHSRGITDTVIDRRFLGWNGVRITIPVFDHKGVCAFFRLARILTTRATGRRCFRRGALTLTSTAGSCSASGRSE